MASLLGQFHFLTLRKLSAGTGLDIGTYTYHEKGVATKDKYEAYKRQWSESRGVSWTLKNRRPEKLRDSFRECEELLDSFPVISIRWRSIKCVQLLLGNGTIITFFVSHHSSDVEKVVVDKSLVGKFSEQICSAAVSDNFMVFSLQEKPQLIYVNWIKKPGLDSKKIEKLSALELKISVVDLPGPKRKRVARNLSLNSRHDMIVVWWPSQSEEVWPWSPMTGEKDRANMIIFAINGAKLERLCYVRTECDPIHAQFSYNQPHHVYTIEQSVTSGGESSIDSCIYEYTRNKIERVTVTSIPLKAPIIVQQRNHTEDKLLIGCEDGTLMLYDDHRRVTQITKASLIPSQIHWHPADTVVVVCSSRGKVQFFDMALAPMAVQLLAENPSPQLVLDLNKHFQSAVTLRSLSWSCEAAIGNVADSTIGCHDNLLLLFERGPVCLFRMELGVKSRGKLGAVEVVSEYIVHNQAEEAVNFLSSMNWNTEGNSCFACMNLIMTFLLKLPLNSTREGLLEDTLGCFYAPSRPLSDVTVLQFRDQISRLSRRFFHHLLRYQRFEKAFLLAVDIGAKDLFMDIHHLAVDVGNQGLAEVAKQRAIEIDNELLTSDTGDSYDDDDLSYEDEEVDELGGVGTTQRFHEGDVDGAHDETLLDGQRSSQTEQTALYAEGLGYNDIEDGEGSDGEQDSGALKIVHFGVV